ncbi:MAG: cation-translocating P-type ATPase, partial [Bacilli bacterium]|nr:cation-translocating P-type ATPase [Bacilli bacterium]
MKKVILKIEGMSCSACQNRVEKYLNKQDGVNASVNLVMAQALIEYDDEKISIDDLNRFVKESGYKSLGVYTEDSEEKKDYTKSYLIGFAFVILFLMYVSMSHMIGLPVIPFLSMVDYPFAYGIALFLLTIPFLVFGFDILKSGFTKLIHRSPNMDSLVTIGVCASFLYSIWNLICIFLGDTMMVEHLYFESSAMILYFLKLGRFIDHKSKEKTKEAIQELVQITPQSALIKDSNGEKEVTIDEVKKGDILICKPGMKVAVDGVIVKGESHFDEAFLTGESTPSKKEKNDSVIAGAISLDGYIEYRAERIGPDSTISEIVHLVMEATNTKTPIQRLADVVSGYFVPAIILISCITFLSYLSLGYSFQEAIISFVTVLVVACPCALGLATPLAIVVSEGKSAKEGILIKNSETLENAHKVDTILFDKTGTLTYGNLKISKIYHYSNFEEYELLKIVSSIERHSTHPIARAFEEYYDPDFLVTDFENLAGIGLSGTYQQKQILVGNSKLFEKFDIKNDHKKEEEKLLEDVNSIVYVIYDSKIIGL